jgi:L-fuconolactonase
MRIDAHQHFWKYTAQEFEWIEEPMAAIRRDFLPPDLKAEMGAAVVDRVISVQARQTIEETEWLLQLADVHDWIAGVVGWVPLISRNLNPTLERFAANRKLRGVRHILQSEPDGYMDCDDFSRGLKEVTRLGLAYELLVFHQQLQQATRLVDRHSNLTMILDHIGKPNIARNELEPWRHNIRELARRPQVYCKISGMVTEADFLHWDEAQLQPFLDAVLEAFGPERLIFGSDWPVARVAIEYVDWVELVNRFVSSLSVTERESIFSGSARKAYNLDQIWSTNS